MQIQKKKKANNEIPSLQHFGSLSSLFSVVPGNSTDRFEPCALLRITNRKRCMGTSGCCTQSHFQHH